MRALCLSMQGKWNVQVRATMPIFRWTVRHAMRVHNRFQPVNGCTPFAAVQGCQYHNKIMALGDAVMVRIQDLKETAKLEPRWCMGIWLGKAVDSDEHIVATLMGIKLGRAIRPVAKEMTPNDFFEKVKWGPAVNPEVSKTVTPPVVGEEAEGGVATGEVPAESCKRKIEDMITGQKRTTTTASTRTMPTTTRRRTMTTDSTATMPTTSTGQPKPVWREVMRPRGGAATRKSQELKSFIGKRAQYRSAVAASGHG